MAVSFHSFNTLASFDWLFQSRPDTFKTAVIVRTGQAKKSDY